MTDDTETNGDGRRGTDTASPERIAEVEQAYIAEGRPFARVTVVRREPPVSAHVGDRALVTLDGELVGWIGGVSCAQSVAIRAATASLRAGEPRLVGLAPDPETVERPGLEAFPMTCHSRGTLELFVEPVTPVPRLVVVGDSPAALALCEMAQELSYDVTVVGDDDTLERRDVTRVPRDVDAGELADRMNGASWVVVASMGAVDDVGCEAALAAGVPYIGLVASERRAAELYADLAERTGRDVDAVEAAITAPAGVDIGARTPEEVAVSLLAELVSVRRSGSGSGSTDASTTSARGVNDAGASVTAAPPVDDSDDDGVGDSDGDAPTAVDPVCGMDVLVDDAAATVEFDGEPYHFCGQGCADAFADDPERFVEHAES